MVMVVLADGGGGLLCNWPDYKPGKQGSVLRVCVGAGEMACQSAKGLTVRVSVTHLGYFSGVLLFCCAFILSSVRDTSSFFLTLSLTSLTILPVL